MACWCPSPTDESGRWRPRVLSCSDDASSIVWDAARGRQLCVLASGRDGHSARISMASWSRCSSTLGSLVLTCSQDKTCILWEVSRHRLARAKCRFPSGQGDSASRGGGPHDAPIWSAYTSTDNHRVLTASMDNKVKIWDVETQLCVQTFAGHRDMVLHATWSSDDSEVLTCSMDCTAILWDPRSPAKTVTLSGHSGCVWSASWGRKLNS